MLNAKDMYILKKVEVKGYDEVIGIIVQQDNRHYELKVITIEGDELQFSPSQLIKVSITRGLDEKVRDMMNKYGKEEKIRFQKLQKMRNEIKELEKERNNENSKVLEGIIEARGLLSQKEFNSKLSETVQGLVPRGFYSNLAISSMYQSMSIDISNDIQKWASPDEYPFLFEEYDRSLHMSEGGKAYNELKARYENKLTLANEKAIKKIEKDFKCKIKTNSYLSIGDKDWLTYEFGVNIDFLGDLSLNKEKLKDVTKIIKGIIG